MKIALAFQDRFLEDALSDSLTQRGFAVCEVGQDQNWGGDIVQIEPSLIILEAVDDRAVDAVRRLRGLGATAPILVIADPLEAEARAAMFLAGADHLVIRPIDMREILARVVALIRRSEGLAQSVIETGPLMLDLDERALFCHGQRVTLTRKEFMILELLFLRRGYCVPRAEFLDHIYDGVEVPGEGIINVYLCRIRAKLKARTGRGDHIVTRPGRGVELVVEAARAPLAAVA